MRLSVLAEMLGQSLAREYGLLEIYYTLVLVLLSTLEGMLCEVCPLEFYQGLVKVYSTTFKKMLTEFL